MKRLIAVCLFAAFLANLVPVTALAAEEWKPLNVAPMMYGAKTTYCEALSDVDDYYIDAEGLIK